MQLSVIILNYNVRFFLEQCIISVQKALSNIDGEIIVIDNASADDSCIMMKEKFPEIKLIENKENLGFPKGNNIGVAQAKGEYICILNPDTVVTEDTFLKILNSKYINSTPKFGILGCKLIDGTGNFLPESKRGVPTPWVAFTKIFGLYNWFPKSKWFNKYYAMQLQENQSGAVDILVGAFMVLKRDLYLQVGGFDEKCFMYSDDIDLSYTIQKMGKINYYFHETSVIHYKGESTVRDQKYMKRFSDAMQFFYKKHFKKSWFFDFFMKIGVFFFTLIKQNQQKNITTKPDIYFFWSESNENFKRIKETFKSEAIHLYSKKEEIEHYIQSSQSKIEIIFDTSFVSFQEIISFMELNKSKNITFKNYISQSNYLIGSNNANDLGKILIL